VNRHPTGRGVATPVSPKPQMPSGPLGLAAAHARAGRLDEARPLLEDLLQRQPADLAAGNLLIQILIMQDDPTALRREIARRLEADRSIAHLAFERSHHTLLFGDLSEGWIQYESRWEVPGLIQPERHFTQPRWGGEPFPGKTLLLHYEQGLGDTLMFIRYAPLAKALGGRVLVAAQVPLADLVATCPGVDEVIPKGASLPPFDLHLPLLSLPRVFGTELDTIPADIPYLDVPAHVPNRSRLSAALAAAEGRTRIGLVWAGNPKHHNDANRSIPTRALAPLAELREVAWYSFQLGRSAPPLPGIVTLDPLLRNLSDTAYALSGMDLVITVDTALAHLAGAMGIPTLLLLPLFPDWRWLLGREDSPWYPSMRLYRQPAAGDWDAVLRRIVEDLARPGETSSAAF
jgi:hypothetical protein